MNNFSRTKTHPQKKKSSWIATCYLLILLFLCIFCSCKTQTNYFDYVSELRSNIFIANTEELSLRIYAVEKENPYLADGIKQETATRAEVYLTAPEGNKEYNLSFTIGENTYGGDMSFDNVKTEYYYACTLDISNEKSIPCKIQCGDTVMEMNATSVRTETTLSAKYVLENLATEEAELFTAMTDKYGFTGEIYLRLIYEDAPYYYVGVIDRNGGINAFLINAQTGKILAKRKS